MDDIERDDLTNEERAAFSALPRERMPGPLLEERTVRALRERGLLRTQGLRGTAWRRGGGLIAAGLLVFAGGFVSGRWAAPAGAVVEQGMDPIREVVAPTPVQVQQAGTAYVDAVTALVASVERADVQLIEQAREVAVAPLVAVATEIARIAPEDPVTTGILRELPQAVPAQQRQDNMTRYVVWF
jgi:hypothetical protein